MPESPPLAILLMGPTASGKTAAAVDLVRKFPLEIVSVDSAMIYRGMDIGTAKPDADTLGIAPHRLIDIVDPTERYSAGRFRQDALRHMAEIKACGKIPLLVGGTMLYFKALTEGLSPLPAADPVLREELDARAAAEGWPRLHAELARLDPDMAARLRPTDTQRIQRALEVCLLAGEPMSKLQRRERGTALPCRTLKIALIPSDRAELHQRIARRFESMLAAGLLEELRGLRGRYPLQADMPSMRCVGYRQAWQHLEGEYGYDALMEKGIAATRQLAKRQLTWLRDDPDLERIDASYRQPAKRVLERVGNILQGV